MRSVRIVGVKHQSGMIQLTLHIYKNIIITVQHKQFVLLSCSVKDARMILVLYEKIYYVVPQL
jgi:hypothetical protein